MVLKIDKKSENMKKKVIVGLMCLVTIGVVVIFSGCIEESPPPKYHIGDVITQKETTNDDMATLVLDYKNETDEYFTIYIFKVGDMWLYQSEKESEEWCDREFIEEYNSVKITHVNLSDVMSWEEYWDGGGHEKYKSIQLRYDFENEGSIPESYYETGDILIDDVK